MRPRIATVAIGLLAGACSGRLENVGPDGGDDLSEEVACTKTVNVHLASWGGGDSLDDPRSPIAPNGCWRFNRNRAFGHYWANCQGASNKGTVFPDTWVNNWGSPSNWTPDGLKLWTYMETRIDRTPYPSDTERMANCWSALTAHWGTEPARGYAYLTYQGPSGWAPGDPSYIQLNFAEMYGAGEWWSHWEQWKAEPVGRPMAQIVDVQNGGNAFTVTQGMCEHIASGNWFGLYLPPGAGSMTVDTPAFQSVVRALNQCTGGASVEPAGLHRCGALAAGDSLVHGESLTSCSERFRLVMQDDGNLVLYDGAVGLWASGTQGTGAVHADMQEDGNLVLYDAAHVAHWDSHTQGHPGAYLMVQDDANLVIYGPGAQALWSRW